MVNKLEKLMLFSLLILMVYLKKNKLSTMQKLYITTNDFDKVSSRVFN